MPRKTPPLTCVETQLVDEVERATLAAKALPLTRLTRLKLTPSASAELLQKLVARGLERGPKTIRVPLATQIEALFQGGARAALKDVAKRVKGGTKTEINTVLSKLVREGRARIVVRTQLEVLVGPADKILDPTQLAQLSKIATQLLKTVKKAQSKGLPRSILHEDLRSLLAPLDPSLCVAIAPDEAPAGLIDEALRRLEDPVLKLVRIPVLVRSLAGRLSIDAIHRALAEAAKGGTLELRPEVGNEFLKAEDLPLCPPGPRGTVLSYVRRVFDDK